MRLEEHGLVEGLEGRGDGGVEALEMANGYDALGGESEGKDVIGLLEGCGEGLFDEDVELGEEKLLGDCGVMDGWDADGCGVEGQVCGEKFGEGREGWDAIGRGKEGAALRDGFYECRELNEPGMSELELAVDTKVIASEGASANDSDA